MKQELEQLLASMCSNIEKLNALRDVYSETNDTMSFEESIACLQEAARLKVEIELTQHYSNVLRMILRLPE